jgi:rRNA maturation endonuclease Nob1
VTVIKEEKKLVEKKEFLQFCHECGKKLDEDVDFCPHCGNKLNKLEEK